MEYPKKNSNLKFNFGPGIALSAHIDLPMPFFFRYLLNLLGNQPKPVHKTSSQPTALTTKVTRSNNDMTNERRSSTAVKVINPVQPNKERRKRGADTKEMTTEKKAKVIDIKSEPDIFDIKMVS